MQFDRVVCNIASVAESSAPRVVVQGVWSFLPPYAMPQIPPLVAWRYISMDSVLLR